MKKVTAATALQTKHFCILPWVHAQLNQSGTVYTCCRVNQRYSYGSLKEKSFSEIWNDQPAKNIRAKLMYDSAFSHCSDCYKVEASGATSLRQTANKEYIDNIDEMINLTSDEGHLNIQKLLYLDLRFSNICNFKCRSCNQESSTSWYKDYEQSTGYQSLTQPVNLTEHVYSQWKDLEELLPYVRRIYFAGGEPLLHDDHYILLEKLISAKRTDVVLCYNSNLSKLRYKNWNVLELWQHFKKVEISASFDGIGPQAELIRKGTKWTDIEKNYKTIRIFLPQPFINIYSTISVMNAFHITNSIEHWINSGMITQPEHFDVNLLTYPEYLNINILNKNEREQLAIHYKQFIEHLSLITSAEVAHSIAGKLQQILQFFEADVWHKEREQFRNYTFRLDQLRAEKFITLFPEHLELLYVQKTVP